MRIRTVILEFGAGALDPLNILALFQEAIRLKSNSEVTLANFVILMCDCGRREQAAIYYKRLNDIKKKCVVEVVR